MQKNYESLLYIKIKYLNKSSMVLSKQYMGNYLIQNVVKDLIHFIKWPILIKKNFILVSKQPKT